MRKAKGKGKAIAKKKIGVLKRKSQSKLKQKVTQIVKKHTGIKTIPKKATQEINKTVRSLIRNPPKKIKSEIRKNISMELKKVIPKKTSIKGGLTHNQLVRQAECAIYSGANF